MSDKKSWAHAIQAMKEPSLEREIGHGCLIGGGSRRHRASEAGMTLRSRIRRKVSTVTPEMAVRLALRRLQWMKVFSVGSEGPRLVGGRRECRDLHFVCDILRAAQFNMKQSATVSRKRPKASGHVPCPVKSANGRACMGRSGHKHHHYVTFPGGFERWPATEQERAT